MPSRRRLLPFLGVLLLAGWGVWLLIGIVDLSLHREFGIDEFEYAHGAWLTAQGQVVFRDFFEAHFPLIQQVLAVPWLLMDDHPTNILVLRMVVLPFLLLVAAAAGHINRRVDLVTAAITPLVILSTAFLVGMGLEIRPDTLALGLFLAAVAVVGEERLAPRLRGFAGGLLVVLAVWGSQKALYYGIVFPAALVADVAGGRGRDGRGFLGDWRAFLGGAGLAGAAIALYLTLTGSWGGWWRWSVLWVTEQQGTYPGFPWTRNLVPLIGLHTWLFALAALGVWATVRGVRERHRGADPDLLLLGLLVSTAASVAWQAAARTYSFLPLGAVLGIFAARGITWAFRALAERRERRPAQAVFGMTLLALLLVGEMAHVRSLFTAGRQGSNAAQLETLRLIGEITEPGDPVFDIAGRAVSRPSVHFFFFTDAVVRAGQADRLASEVPAAIVERGAAVYIHDERWPSLPQELRSFVRRNFQPMTPEVWLWGRSYEVPPAGLDDRFLAVRPGRYFIHPPSAIEDGAVRLAGGPVASPVFELGKGEVRVEASGAGVRFALLWLPQNGRRWRPLPHPVAE